MMRKNKFLSAVALTAAVFAGSLPVYAANSSGTASGSSLVMNRVDVGSEAGDIAPGIYIMSGARQVRITDKNRKVTLFKGQLPKGDTSSTELKNGDTVEYSGRLYLTAVNETVNETADAILNPITYSPIKNCSMLGLMSGYHTSAENGYVSVYNRKNELKACVRFEATENICGYIFNDGMILSEKEDEEEITGDSIELKSGVTYTVGSDFDAAAYLASGSGTVRVYDRNGYIKTVIRLKRPDKGSDDGVDSYTFKLNDSETLITDGSVEFRQIIENK